MSLFINSEDSWPHTRSNWLYLFETIWVQLQCAQTVWLHTWWNCLYLFKIRWVQLQYVQTVWPRMWWNCLYLFDSTSICTNSFTTYMVKLFVHIEVELTFFQTNTNSFTTYAVKLFVFVLNNVNVIIRYHLATTYHMCIFISHSRWLYVDKHISDFDKSLLSSYMSNIAQTLHQPLFENFYIRDSV